MILREIKYEFHKCRQCIYKENVPGDAHIQCSFDWITAFKNMTVPYYPIGTRHGIEHGWYSFPFYFDPMWMAIPCPAFHDRELTGDDASPVMKSDESLRVIMMIEFTKNAFENRITEEQFNYYIQKYNKVMRELKETDTEDSDKS